MRAPPRVLSAFAFTVLLLAAGDARADEQSDLDKARAAYLARQYDDAELRLRSMLDPMSGTLHDPALITQARMYLAASVLQKGKRDEANSILEKLLLDDPQYEPDPLSFPTATIDLFIDVRARIRDKLNAQAEERARFEAALRAHEAEVKRQEAARVAMLEKLSMEETVTTAHSRWVALVPFGTGQFQNGKNTLGWVFLGTEVSLLAAAAVTIPIYLTDLQSRSDAYRNGNDFQAQEYIDRAYTVFYANLAFAGAFAAASIVGVIEAEANYVPSVVEVRHRAIPPPTPVPPVPILTPSADGRGAMVGFVGRF